MKTPQTTKAMRGFATTQTVVTILGYTLLGFESSVLACLSGLLAAYFCQILFRACLIWEGKATAAPFRSLGQFIDFLLPAHIVALTTNFFVYGGDRVGPTVLAVVLAISSKHLILVMDRGTPRHFLNPANFGILATLLFFPSISISLPYQFHSGLGAAGDIMLPVAILVLGLFTNIKLTKRLPLVIGWLVAFIAQAAVRYFAFDVNFLASIGPATGAVGMLFTFYMITDPVTTPTGKREQVLFGASIGLVYGLLMTFNVVFGLFWAVLLTSTARGVCIFIMGRSKPSHTSEDTPPVYLQAG